VQFYIICQIRQWDINEIVSDETYCSRHIHQLLNLLAWVMTFRRLRTDENISLIVETIMSNVRCKCCFFSMFCSCRDVICVLEKANRLWWSKCVESSVYNLTFLAYLAKQQHIVTNKSATDITHFHDSNNFASLLSLQQMHETLNLQYLTMILHNNCLISLSVHMQILEEQLSSIASLNISSQLFRRDSLWKANEHLHHINVNILSHWYVFYLVSYLVIFD